MRKRRTCLNKSRTFVRTKGSRARRQSETWKSSEAKEAENPNWRSVLTTRVELGGRPLPTKRERKRKKTSSRVSEGTSM